MILHDDKYYIKAAWIWILFFTLFRLIYSSTFQLAPDETNYWQWSRHLAWGYYDQAPMIAWAIKLATLVFGHTEVAVRFSSVLAMAIASAYLVMIAKRWIGVSAAFNTAVLTQGIFEFNVGGLLATPDGLQAAAWAAASYHVARGYGDNRWFQWIAGGLWFGFGMLSKYTMVIFLPGAFLYGLISRTHRQRLANIRPYVGVMLGILMFMPVILWNIDSGWSSFRHVAYIGGANTTFSLHIKYLADYFASQAGLLSPLAFILVLLSWYRSLRKKYWAEEWIYPYLFFTSFPMVAGFALLSLHTRVYGNWPGSGYLTVSILAAAFFGSKSEYYFRGTNIDIGRKIWLWAIGTSYLLTAIVLLQVVCPVLPIPIKWDRISTEIYGWNTLGRKAGELRKTMPNPEKTFLFGLRYQVASELAFYTPGQPQTVSINKWGRPNVYDYWWKDEDLIGWDAVGVTYDPESHTKRLNQTFDHVDPPIKLKIYRDPVFTKTGSIRKPVTIFYLYRAYGFKGGLRWVPPVTSDIRAN
jgi:undecaprenyl-diphosphatase